MILVRELAARGQLKRLDEHKSVLLLSLGHEISSFPAAAIHQGRGLIPSLL
jgi:hypothetical protein